MEPSSALGKVPRRDQDATPAWRLARGGVRADVQRQERRADPATPPCRDRRAARVDREAADRHPLRRRTRRLPRRGEDARCHGPRQRGGRAPRGRVRRRGDRRGAVLRRRDRRGDRVPRLPRGEGRRCRSRARLPRTTVRGDADAALRRRVRRQARGGVPPLRRTCDDDTATCRRTACTVRRGDDPGRRTRLVRSSLPCLPFGGRGRLRAFKTRRRTARSASCPTQRLLPRLAP